MVLARSHSFLAESFCVRVNRLTVLPQTQVLNMQVWRLLDLFNRVKQLQAFVGAHDSLKRRLLYLLVPRTVQIYLFDFLNILYYLIVLQITAMIMNILAAIVLSYFLIALMQPRRRKQALLFVHPGLPLFSVLYTLRFLFIFEILS